MGFRKLALAAAIALPAAIGAGCDSGVVECKPDRIANARSLILESINALVTNGSPVPRGSDSSANELAVTSSSGNGETYFTICNSEDDGTSCTTGIYTGDFASTADFDDSNRTANVTRLESGHLRIEADTPDGRAILKIVAGNCMAVLNGKTCSGGASCEADYYYADDSMNTALKRMRDSVNGQ